MADISLEIHHLDARGGDATAIIVKQHYRDEPMDGGPAEETSVDLYRMLIDAGAESGGSAALKLYLEKHLEGPFDLIIATHYHQDHIQGFSQAGIHYKAFVDNGSYRDAVGTFEPINDIGRGSRSKIFRAYGARTQELLMFDRGNPGSKAKPTRTEIPFIKKDFNGKAEPLVIKLGDTGITLTCYCANGILANGTNVLKQQKDIRKKAINPNDVSLAFVLEWGEFRYLTAGDLSGATTSTNYYNIEKELVDYLIDPVNGPLKNKKITVFKASHHGSEHSNQAYLFEKLKPETVIVSCNLQKRVPSPVFLERLKTHFTGQANGKVIFTNTLKVFKNSALYSKLNDLTAFIPKGNVTFPTGRAQDAAASNLGIKTAIIRRRVTDGAYKSDENVPPGATRTEMTNYEIVLTERDAQDAEDADTLTFKDYDFRSSWAKGNCSLENIRHGFSVQAKEMVRWLKADATPDAKSDERTKGGDYIRKFYPALVEVIEDFDDEKPKDPQYVQIETNLNNKMNAMLDDAFTEFTLTGAIMYRWNPENTLTQDDKMTLYNLLVENVHQMIFTQSYPTVKVFKETNCWNVKWEPEPYTDPPPTAPKQKKVFAQYPGMTSRTDKRRKIDPK